MLNDPRYRSGNIYLSGGMNARNALGAGWRKECSRRLRLMGYLPLDIAELDIAYSDANEDMFRFTNDEDVTGLSIKSNVRKHFIDTDIKLIRNDTDAIIILYDEHVRTGAGSISECYEAFVLGMPVFLVNAYPEMKDVPGWLQAETTKIFSTFDELYDYLGTLPPGILKRDLYGNRRSGDHYLCSLCGSAEQKSGAHFVSKISPTYCKQCVEITAKTYEQHKDRYEFFVEYLTKQFNGTI